MKNCPKCNRECNDGDRFCIQCGHNFEAEQAAPAAEPQVEQVAPPAAPQPQIPTYQPVPPVAEDDTVSTGKWVLYHLIPFIPVVGSIVYIVMLFVWGFGDNAKNKTFRNWARAQLIFMAISLVLSVLVIVLAVVITGSLFGLASEASNSIVY